jgi:hypothetical protein
MIWGNTVQRCWYCRKPVRNKPLLGTLHVCLTDGERRIRDAHFEMGCAAAAEQARIATKCAEKAAKGNPA